MEETKKTLISLPKDDSTVYQVDNRIQLKDGRLYTSRTPYKGGLQLNHTELVDVTEEVLKALLRAYDKQRANKDIPKDID